MADWSGEIRALLEDLELDPARESEIAEELGQHLSDRYEELLRGGASPEEAGRAAWDEVRQERLVAELRSVVRSPRTPIAPGVEASGGWFFGLGKDLRFGARLLRLSPGFAVAAILSLALGIGANTAIFQLLDAVRLRALPVDDPARLCVIRIEDNGYGRTGDFSGNFPQLTYPVFQRLRAEQRGFSRVAAWGMERGNLSQGGEERDAEVLWASGGLFATLGVRPSLGRLLQDSDDYPGCGSSVVLSDAFWRREFGGAADVLGRKLVVEGRPLEVIGVAQPSFFGVEVGRRFDVALPICAEPMFDAEKPRIDDRESWWLAAIGRLKPGWSPQRASAQLAAASRALFESTLPPGYDTMDARHYLDFKLGAVPAAAGVSELRQQYETPLWFLLATSGLVLLIACANLANLIMARASARQREMAVRLALGASPVRLVRQLICENVLLVSAGGLGALVLSQALSRALMSFLRTQGESWLVDLTLDWRVLAFAVGAAAMTCAVFGVAPAIQAARTSPGEVIKSSPRGATAGRSRMVFRRALVVTQVALSLVLLVGALLFMGTFRNLMTVDAGFQRSRILVASLDLSPLKIPMERRLAYRREMLARLRAIPGVLSAADALIVPVSGRGWNDNVGIPGTSVRRRLANFNRVSPDYFRTMGTPLLAGRDFGPADTISSPLVAVVTEMFVRKFFGSGNPVGRTLAVAQKGGKPDQIYQIVGLVKDSKYGDLREEFTPIVFTAADQNHEPGLEARLVLRSNQDLAALAASVKRAIEDVNPAIAFRFTVFETMLREGLLRERLMSTLSGFFGLLAALLAMIGLYGVISYTVARRRNEIGVRMALGAGRRDVLTMILKEAAVLLGIGLAIGAGLSLVGGQSAKALLFGLRPGDPFTLALAILSLSAVALAASFLPARRAASLDPMLALREE